MEPPYVIKPVNEGSSVGVFIIRKGDNRPPAALGSDKMDTLSNEMMVEKVRARPRTHRQRDG